MSRIAFVPLRGGSKSVPLKNIKLLSGRPLACWVIKAAQEAKCIDKIVVATDSEKIKSEIGKFDFKKVVFYDRDPNNAQDNSSTESVMLEYIKNSNLDNDDIFFLLQATSPLLKAKDIEGMYQKYVEDKADSLLSCVRCRRFFWDDEGRALNYDYTKRPRRQDFKGVYMENGACYINKVSNILKHLNRLSGKISIYEMLEYTGFELDEPDDFLLIERLMEKYSCQK